MKLWKELIAGSERGLQCCVQGKLDMQEPNKSLQDPVYYCCNPIRHHRIGSKYKIYPTYDFACPFVDALEGITHALRLASTPIAMCSIIGFKWTWVQGRFTFMNLVGGIWFIQFSASVSFYGSSRMEGLMGGMILAFQPFKGLGECYY